MNTAQFPSRYVQGPGALALFGTEASRLGYRALLLIDKNVPSEALDDLDISDLRVTQRVVEPVCTPRSIETVVQVARDKNSELIAGLGGGKVVDLARAAADEVGLPFVSVPTIAASDAPCSALAVVYDETGKVLYDRFVRKNPDLVLVDSSVIAAAPTRFFSAGIGDALATFFEADACRRSGSLNVVGGLSTKLAQSVALLCFETVRDRGAKAVAACRRNETSEAFEEVLEAAILLSGIGFESGGVAAAHAFHHGIAELPESHGALHGEKVAFGVLAELALNSESDERIREIAEFNLSVNLPVCLQDLGITDRAKAIPIIAARATRAGEIIHNEPMPVTQSTAAEALLRADDIGQSMRS